METKNYFGARWFFDPQPLGADRHAAIGADFDRGAHAPHIIVMVIDGASSHVAKALVVPENIHLHRLPGYSPELNLQEHLWDELREKEFPNRVFSDMAGVVRTLEAGRPRLAADQDRVRSICA